MKIKLLVINEEEGICDFIKRFFEDRGLEVFYALSGKEGLEIFKKKSPQIIILDMRIKEKEAMELIKRIKEIEKQNYIFIFRRRSHPSDTAVIGEAKRLGAYHYLEELADLKETEGWIMHVVKEIKQKSKQEKIPQ